MHRRRARQQGEENAKSARRGGQGAVCSLRGAVGSAFRGPASRRRFRDLASVTRPRARRSPPPRKKKGTASAPRAAPPRSAGSHPSASPSSRPVTRFITSRMSALTFVPCWRAYSNQCRHSRSETRSPRRGCLPLPRRGPGRLGACSSPRCRESECSSLVMLNPVVGSPHWLDIALPSVVSEGKNGRMPRTGHGTRSGRSRTETQVCGTPRARRR